MGNINKEWHTAHLMPKNPTRDERGEWHSGHLDECGCRTTSEAEALLIAEYRAKSGSQLA